MADVKISQLPSATAPLGATDVLPVVQSGVTKKIAASTFAQVGQDNSFTASQTIAKTSASDTMLTLVSELDGVNDYQSALSVRRAGTAGGALWQSKRNTATGGVGWVARVTADNAAEVSGTFSDAIEITNDGNLKISTSGKGIDFSATPGTGTSELLADYEEGTFTPTVTSGSGAITAYTSGGYYRKVGSIVTIQLTAFITTAGTAGGSLSFSLPFTSLTTTSAQQQYAGTIRESAATGVIYYITIGSNTASAFLQTATNGAVVWLDGYTYTGSITYFAAS